MKSLRIINKLFVLASAVLLFSSCEKENNDFGPDVNFKTEVDGLKVKFTNLTEGATFTRWDFGDGSTSTNPTAEHTYSAKGKYTPTLYVSEGGKEYEGSTVIRISKGSSVRLNDNSLADWDTVSRNSITYPTGYFRKVKLDYDGENIYFYMEVTSTLAAGDIFDFYMDTDNNASTGLVTWVSTGAGNDVLLEGAMLANWFDVFYHTGPQNSFTFNPQTISDFYSIGTVQQAGPILKFEGKLVRSKIKNLTGRGFKLAVTSTKSDWSATLGIFPTPGVPAMYLDASE